MKKNTRKFEKSMRIIIRRIIDNQPFSEFYTDNPEPLCECIDREYIGGIVYGRAMNGTAHFTLTKPFVRYKGIEFLESKHPEFKSNGRFYLSIFSAIVSVLALIVSFLSQYIDIQTVLNQYF